MCANRELLTDVLRTEYGFEGWVVSDCGGVSNIAATHHYANTTAEAAAAAIAAGLDIMCDNVTHVAEALAQGLLRPEQLDTPLYRIFLQQVAPSRATMAAPRKRLLGSELAEPFLRRGFAGPARCGSGTTTRPA